jgi:hypothetical protein
MKNFICICFLSSLSVAFSLEKEFPSDVQWLVSKRNEAVARIDQTFVEELGKLKVKYTKAGDLENANTVAALIKQTKESNREEGFSLDGEWRYQIYEDYGDVRSSVRRFKGKNLIDEHGRAHPWVYENDGITIKWNSSSTHFEKIILDHKNPDVIKGINSGGNRFSYTRIK